MTVTIQEALHAVKGATPDDLNIILDVLGTDGFTRDKAAGPIFLELDAEDYKERLSKYPPH